MAILTSDELAAVRREYRAATLLPARTYQDAAVFEWEREHILRRDWIVVGREEEVRASGGLEVRVDGEVVAALAPGTARNRPTATVPGWREPVPVACDAWQGFVFVNLSDGDVPPLRAQLGDLVDQLDRLDYRTLRSAQRIEYEVAANWKLIAENYSECYHCPGVHPQLNRLTPYDLGGDFDPDGAWQGGWMELVGEAETMALDGGHGSRHGRPPMCGITPTDEKRIYYYVLWPTTFLSVHPDYLLVHRLVPRDPGHTLVVCDWLFEADTIATPGFDPADAVAFWDLTNRQDWHVCELQQRGTGSRSWVAGRYSNQEASVQAFDLMVADRYAGEPFGSGRTVRERYDVPPPKPKDGAGPGRRVRRPARGPVPGSASEPAPGR